MSHFTTRGPGKEHRTHKSPSTRRIGKGPEERENARPRVLPESSSLASMLADCRGRHQEGRWVRMIGQRRPGNESPHHKLGPRATCRAVLPGPSPGCSRPGTPPNDVACFVSTRVSSDNSFLSLDESPLQGRGRPVLWHSYHRQLAKCELRVWSRENQCVWACIPTLSAGVSHLLGMQTMSKPQRMFWIMVIFLDTSGE